MLVLLFPPFHAVLLAPSALVFRLAPLSYWLSIDVLIVVCTCSCAMYGPQRRAFHRVSYCLPFSVVQRLVDAHLRDCVVAVPPQCVADVDAAHRSSSSSSVHQAAAQLLADASFADVWSLALPVSRSKL